MILFDQKNQIKKEIVNAHDYVDNSEKLELNLRSVWIEGEGGGVKQHRFGLKLAYFQPILLYSLYFPSSPPPSKSKWALSLPNVNDANLDKISHINGPN